MSEFVSVYSKSTGQKQDIPEDWLDHPVLGADFELTPSARAAREEAGSPTTSDQTTPLPVDETSSADELLQYAADNEIDVDDAADEASALALIRKHHESTSSVEEE